jgi:hypothetical protein
MARAKGSKNKVTVKSDNTRGAIPEENYLFIDNLPSVMIRVKELIADKKINPSVIQEDEVGVVFINGEPCMIIDNSYLPVKQAQLIFQTRKVVREYIKLQNLINNVTE